MSKPRTPEYFPRMNDRAGRRRARRTAARWETTPLGRLLTDFGAACARIADTLTAALRSLPPRKQDYALSPAPLPRGITSTLATRAETMLGARRSSEGTR